MSKKRIPVLVIALTVALAVAILTAYFFFSRSVSSHMMEGASLRLKEIVQPNVDSFNYQINGQMKKAQVLADYLGAGEASLDSEENLALLYSSAKTDELLRCSVAFPDGSVITSDGARGGNVSEEDYFLENQKGNAFVSHPRPAATDPEKMVILFTSPIMRDGKFAGSVINSYLCEDMSSVFSFSFLDGNGEMLVVCQSGDPIIGQENRLKNVSNIVEYLQEHCTHQNHAADACLTLAASHGECTLTLGSLDSPLLVWYDRLSVNDWYMLSLAPQSVTTDVLAPISDDQRNLGVALFVVAVLYVTGLLFIWFSHRRSVDGLTGALTLEGLKRKAKQQIHRAAGAPYVFVKLDVKDFKLINRIYSFEEGNRLIKNIALALEQVLKPYSAAFARVGTDDFILLLPYNGRKELNALREQFITAVRELMGPKFTTRVEFPTGQYLVTADDYQKPDILEMLEKVNFAHRASKQRGGGRVLDYAEDMEREALLEKAVEDKMDTALTNGGIQMYLQPKYRVADEKICGAEALARWLEDDRLFLPPADFVPLLEKNGFIVKVDLFMFEQAAKWLRDLLDRGGMPITISVNFSRCHLSNEGFAEKLCQIADRYQIPHRYLEIELTESTVFDNVERIAELISQLHAAGFTMSMDDFGSGYSCLSLLKDLDVDVLKLDKGFFDQSSDPDRAAIVVDSIFQMAKKLGVSTVAEGIETKEQVEQLRTMGCDVIQGFYYSRPVPAADLLPEQEKTQNS